MGTAGKGKVSKGWVGHRVSTGLAILSTPQRRASCAPCCLEEPEGTSGSAAEGRPTLNALHPEILPSHQQSGAKGTHSITLPACFCLFLPHRHSQKDRQASRKEHRHLAPCLRGPADPFSVLTPVLGPRMITASGIVARITSYPEWRLSWVPNRCWLL